MSKSSTICENEVKASEPPGGALRVTKSRLDELRTSLAVVHAALIPGITISRPQCGPEGLSQIVCRWPLAF